jgi:uncharacterized protein involved in response to NO
MLSALCIFCASAAGAFHEFLGEPSGPLAILALLAGYFLCSSIALWIHADAVQRGRRVAYDFDSLFFFFWPFAAPIYLFRTRGWDAVASLGLFLLLQLGGFLFAVVLGYPYSIASLRAHFS